MKFGPVSLDQAEGKFLGHNIAGPDGHRLLRKGRAISSEDIETLRDLGRETVYVAELEAGDVEENVAANRIASAVSGQGIRLSGPATGRANLYAQERGVLRVDVDRLARLNAWDGISLATLVGNTAVREAKMVATVKVLPYAIPETNVSAAESIASEAGPLIHVSSLVRREVGLILSGSPFVRDRIVVSFESALRRRLLDLGSEICQVDFVPLEDESDETALAAAIGQQVAAGLEMIILAGETAIMDRHDIAPRAVERAGGIVTCYGAPVDPGNLLMLAYMGSLPIMGAPGCARSPKANIVDLILPRLLVGDSLTRADIINFGHGGLLEDVPERPVPRSKLP